jgi:hypothetical protein
MEDKILAFLLISAGFQKIGGMPTRSLGMLFVITLYFSLNTEYINIVTVHGVANKPPLRSGGWVAATEQSEVDGENRIVTLN